jgi:glutamyl/glutaminyl-tRNA synthetase
MNTRFNPTVNGPLHVGHLYLILLNYHAAKSDEGEFVVRFDDDQPCWRNLLGEGVIQRNIAAIKEDLEWLDLNPDHYSSERSARPVNEWFIAGFQNSDLIMQDGRVDRIRDGELGPTSIGYPRNYPFAPYLTACKVFQDFCEGIDLLIRGEDLIDEFSLYCYFCSARGLPIPRHVYVPRMRQNVAPFGTALRDLAGVSKTGGDYEISSYRGKGWTPEALIKMVACSALENPCKGWVVGNVKQQPIVGCLP